MLWPFTRIHLSSAECRIRKAFEESLQEFLRAHQFCVMVAVCGRIRPRCPNQSTESTDISGIKVKLLFLRWHQPDLWYWWLNYNIHRLNNYSKQKRIISCHCWVLLLGWTINWNWYLKLITDLILYMPFITIISFVWYIWYIQSIAINSYYVRVSPHLF